MQVEFDTNGQLEVMEFEVGKNTYGINIAKVREVIQYEMPTSSPDQHPCIEGIYMLRGEAVPIINLSKRLGTEDTSNPDRDLNIITTFNNLKVGLHVHRINGIKKLTWKDIEKPDETISRYDGCITTGIIKQSDKIVVLLDFEKIVADINPVTTIQLSDVKKNENAETHIDRPIMIVDDSPMLNKLIQKALKKAGCSNIISKDNGQEAWDTLSQWKEAGNIKEKISVIITDIEMPAMDGLTLCRKIKDDHILSGIPVILFSSIIDESMKAKGELAGADQMLSKPEIGELVNLLDKLLK